MTLHWENKKTAVARSTAYAWWTARNGELVPAAPVRITMPVRLQWSLLGLIKWSGWQENRWGDIRETKPWDAEGKWKKSRVSCLCCSEVLVCVEKCPWKTEKKLVFRFYSYAALTQRTWHSHDTPLSRKKSERPARCTASMFWVPFKAAKARHVR